MKDEFNVYKNNEFIGTYDTAGVAKLLNIQEAAVVEIANTTKKYKKWRIVKLYKYHIDAATQQVMNEWDKFTEPYRSK